MNKHYIVIFEVDYAVWLQNIFVFVCHDSLDIPVLESCVNMFIKVPKNRLANKKIV